MKNKKDAMLMTVYRDGEFDAPYLFNGYGKCGAPDQTRYKYHVKIKSSEVDEDGFVIDHDKIVEYFDTTYASRTGKMSCEDIARAGVNHFRRVLPDAVHVEVCIYSFEYANVTVEWTAA